MAQVKLEDELFLCVNRWEFKSKLIPKLAPDIVVFSPSVPPLECFVSSYTRKAFIKTN